MSNRHTRFFAYMLATLFGALATFHCAEAENIAVGNYGSSANGMPFADEP